MIRRILFFIIISMVFSVLQLFAQDLEITRRVMTDVEFFKLKEHIGVYQPGQNYNIKVNGHGTGLKPPTEADWDRIKSQPVLIDKIANTNNRAKASPNHDNSATNWFPPIGNQDGKGACVAWAEGYYVKTYQEAKERNWNLSAATWDGGYYGAPTSSYQNKIFSPDFIYHQINNGVDEGSAYTDAMDLLKIIGCCTWDRMPYNTSNHTNWPDDDAWRQAPLYRSQSGYGYMWVDTDTKLADLKTYLENGNLVTISINANEYNKLTNDDLWVANSYSGTTTNHANTVVGYDDNFGPYTESGTSGIYGAFKVANSWGEGGWENDADGFYYISYQTMMQRIKYVFVYNNLSNYKPLLLAVFDIHHNNRADCEVTLGIGETSSPLRTKRLDDFYWRGGNHPFPSNDMALDITEFVPYMNNTSDKFFLNVHDGSSSTTGQIASFSVEKYSNYASGVPTNTYTSTQTPKTTINNSNNYVALSTSDVVSTIQLLPATVSLENTSGEVSIAVNCTGSGDMTWNASISSGTSWLSIKSGNSGNGNGTIVLQYTPNSSFVIRNGTLQVTAAWASNTPQNAQISQAASDEQIITVISPNGGENWEVGSSHNLTWSSCNISSAVKIEYTTNNGSSWATVIASTTNDGSHSWTIPNAPSVNCKIKITDTGGSTVDQSDGKFTILQHQEITLVSPNGGEIFQAGANPTILWASEGTSGTVNIDYSINNGDSWTRIYTNIADDLTESWLVPNTPSRDGLIKIEDSDGYPSDTSNRVFTIYPDISHFSFNSTNTAYPIQVHAVLFENTPVSEGDEIGVFATNGQGGRICAGAAVVFGDAPYSLVAWGDDSLTSLKDGFISGETLHFRFWDSSEEMEYGPESEANFTSGNGSWGNGSNAGIDPLKFKAGSRLTLNLNSGWNWISSYVDPEDANMTDVWSQITGLKIVKGLAGFFIPGTINGIGNWNVSHMYLVNLETEQDLVISGAGVSANTPINLTPGWNWTSYLPDTPINAETALASIAGQLSIVKAIDGFYIPGKINSIGNMYPGFGYKMYLNQNATLVYPNSSSAPENSVPSLSKSVQQNATHFTDIIKTSDYHVILINNIDIQDLQAGTEIGLYTAAEKCIGSAVYQGHFPVGIMAREDDPQTDKIEGYRKGDQIIFKLWDPTTGKEMSADYTLQSGNNDLSTPAFSEVNLIIAASVDIPTEYTLEQNYPNPFNPVSVIRYGLPETDVVTLKVYNILGKEVSALVNHVKQEAGWYNYSFTADNLPSGLYFARLQTSTSTFICKMMYVK